ncbi:MAG: tRNA (adenosine(37)-N6)-threonylcarbamoyltransferase complex dimerization subunit type 1 TsaB [Baekduia sp.]
MTLLALDTSTAATVVAVGDANGGLLADARHDPAAGDRPGHTSELLALAEQALTAAGIAWGDLDEIAVSVGPGGFTGLRVGLATARSLASSLGLATRPVVSLDALAAGAPRGDQRPVIAAIDARRGELFARRYGAGGAPQDEPSAVTPAALACDGSLVIGDGAIRYREVIEAAGGRVPAADDLRHAISTAGLLAAAVAATQGELVPLYLRQPDAEPSR